ncbi:2-oxo acid dehydrogenase subunit E2 [Spiroplasma citri]|uniref:2-oxo acid dehydrogenase subunit E2 n=1 Tax=Spiroplasma citri TaxID=2133 RepID=A0AAX3SZZ7_SPICI|nr:2-oxo acid dehydrogenase subunit E2 [Spiroplasma citri]WFG96818.1 2-oxo acid dehydrogenase subunit E2 [Spiroplasma citri]WFH00714.1 2-oxo acid dehydrogenase subunit E2 [Spiroplasma citri]
MSKIIFEADDNRKGIVDKIFVTNKQVVQKGDKIANIITQNKVYEIKAPITGEVLNVIVYENKVINSGDVLLDLLPFEPTLNEQHNHFEQPYNTVSFNGSGKYNMQNRPPIDIKKSETEIFREELIETLLAREVAGENLQDDFDDSIEIDLPEENIEQDSTPFFSQNNNSKTFPFKDKVENVLKNIPSEENIETLQKDLGDLKEDLAIVKDDLTTMTIEEEIIEDLENLERDLAFKAEIAEKKQVDDKISEPLINHHPFDVKKECKPESNTKEELKSNFASIQNNVDDSKMQPIINLEKDKLVDDESKGHHREHSKSHSTVHSSAPTYLKKHKAEDVTSREHAAFSGHKIKENTQSLQVDKVKLNQEAIIRAKEIMESKKNIAHSFIDVEADVSELVSLLSIMREAYSQNDIELTLLPFYAKAVYDGLKKFPILNSSFISQEKAILLKWFYNIAFSVDSDTAVKMPVLYNLKNVSIKEIASKVTKLIGKSINNELKEKDYQDASFSIVNYGEYGITRGTFTIPDDNVAGIAMGIIFKKPVVVEKNDIAIRDIMVITLGYNEAVIDITEASKFVHYVAYLLSNPGLLL